MLAECGLALWGESGDLARPPATTGLQSVMELALLTCERMWASCEGAFGLETGCIVASMVARVG